MFQALLKKAAFFRFPCLAALAAACLSLSCPGPGAGGGAEEDFENVLVTSARDSGAGTLRDALNKAADVATIHVNLSAGSVIALASSLPAISKNLTIEGNGAVLTRAASWTAVDDDSQLLNISSGGTVTIRRVHFKDGQTSNYGGAICNLEGNLTLESCIFSGNQTSAYGGAVYTNGNLTARGCTFYNNSTAYQGGAIYQDGGTTTLSGNLFYGNTAASDSNGHVVYGDVTSTGYNIADRPRGTAYTSGQSGFDHADDAAISALPFMPLNFKVFSGSEVDGIITALPATYPAVDFYGNPRSWPGAPGAVK